MYKHIWRIFIFLISVFFISPVSKSQVALEKVLPPTPEAAGLGKYGNFPVGMFTGTPNVNIELYTLKNRNISIPLSLNYSSNGLKVDDMPTKAGMSWVFNAGGAITRTVYDKPDDTYTRAAAPPSTDFPSHTSTDLTLPSWLENIDVNHLDTQFDEYNFNFNGYSGKFIIDLNNKPVLIPYSNLKIELSPFRITTPEGIQYTFGDNGATESSQISSGSCSREDTRGAKSAWYLTKIVDLSDPLNYIDITYINAGYTYTATINHTITFWDNSNTCTGNWSTTDPSNSDPCGCGPTPCIYGSKGSVGLSTDKFCANTQIVSIPYINEITSSIYGKIKFIYTNNTTYSQAGTPIAIDRLLTSIQVFQNNDGTSLLKSYNLTYTFTKPVNSGKITSLDGIPTEDPDINSYRPFLSSLKELDNLNAVIKTHSFEYNDINNLTARLSSSQDFWGYYNGKSNPHSLIPSDGTTNSLTLLAASKIADRNPDYNFAIKGMLSKIIFPTGGYSQFLYEGNTDGTTPPSTAPHYAPVNNATGIQATNTTHSATFYVFEPTTVTITRSILCCSGGSNNCTVAANSLIWGQINFTPSGSSTATTFKTYSFAEYNQRGECSFSRDETLILQPGIYGLSVPGFDNYQLTLLTKATNGSIYFLDTYVPTTASANHFGAGMRVKQQVIYDPISQISTTTNYQYNGIVIPYHPTYINNISNRNTEYYWEDKLPGGIVCVGPFSCGELKICNYIQFSSNSSINTNGRGGSPVYYTSVTESTGDNFILGGIEHTYSYYVDAGFNLLRGNIVPNTTTPSFSWKNGLETNQNIFKMINGNKVYLKKITNTYTDDPRINNNYTQYIIKKSGQNDIITVSANCPASSVFNRRMDVFDILSYATLQQWTYLSSKQEINYDINGNNPVTTTTNYFYDNPLHALLSRIQISNSKNELITTTIKYPFDYTITGTATDNIAKGIQNLQTNYIINPVVEKYQQKSNTDGTNLRTLTSTFTTYKASSLYPDLIFQTENLGTFNFTPATISASATVKDSRYQSRISFDIYDLNGNILRQHQLNNITQSYIWDYKNVYPIAEVVNASNTDIAHTSFESDGKGNLTFTGTASADATAPTGNNCYNLGQASGNITKTGLTSGNQYIVSYWTKNLTSLIINGTTGTKGRSINTWTYYQHLITLSGGTITISGTGYIDELRLYPANAQMTTYTYKPLIGISSRCDVNNRISYYEYDAFGRLKLIRDQDKNIVKRFDYQYQQQP